MRLYALAGGGGGGVGSGLKLTGNGRRPLATAAQRFDGDVM